MTTASASTQAAPQQPPAMSPTQDQGQSVEDIPRRLMRVKVLYTFDDQNKSNCLARLHNALSIPTVSLDENTQVGVIELKTCIQAVVSASPELVAKLGHDYTVYAYDYSEYETPLVGQGMLSWLLASASVTPNAPAEQSKTMVTGRVCNNILGLFSNGVKETLEVKLKLVPVPTCMQSEYVENMERYHNLSKVMPEGLSDYSAWAEFLNANPAIRQLAQPAPNSIPQANDKHHAGGVDSLHQMLARQTPHEDTTRFDNFHDQYATPYYNTHETRASSPAMSFNPYYNPHDTRASSPAMSTASFQLYQYQPNPTRPASQASFRSESANQLKHYLPPANPGQEEQEEGPPKKRAHITKAKRPRKNTALGTNNDSLRVTASTAASVRNVRPNGPNPGVSVSMEQVPRAPTPRPENAGFLLNRGPLRPPAPSLLRNASIDEGRTSYMSPYDSGIMSDNAIESADDEKARSPVETPMTLPSSPPPMPRRTISPARSSPELPSLPPPPAPPTLAQNDSGFVSDLPNVHDVVETQEKAWTTEEVVIAPEIRTTKKAATAPETRTTEEVTTIPETRTTEEVVAVPETKPRKKADNSKRAWAELNPGPVDLLPQSYVPKLNQHGPYGRPRDMGHTPINANKEESDLASVAPNASVNEDLVRSLDTQIKSTTSNSVEQMQPSSSFPPPETVPFCLPVQTPQAEPSPGTQDNVGLPESAVPVSAPNVNESNNIIKPPQKPTKKAKPRGLPRSHTWSGSEPMSDSTLATGDKPIRPPNKGRNKNGPPNKVRIKNKMQQALDAGEMPVYCNNCGQIETPAWRRAFMRIENGVPDGIQVSSKGTDITAYEIMEPEEDGDGTPRYRIFKQLLDDGDTASQTFTSLTLCNPCGLWLGKKNAMRPHHVWAKKEAVPDKNKKKRIHRRKPRSENDGHMSDAIVPNSEANAPDSQEQSQLPSFLDGTVDQEAQSAMPRRASSAGFVVKFPFEDSAAQAALMRAIQSSPVGLRRGSKDSPISLDMDLTPKPTRRLLFPSPRHPGEKKLLSDHRFPHLPQKQLSPSSKNVLENQEPDDLEENDKENCPPSARDNDHDLSRVFESTSSQKTTPEGQSFEDLLKTPTPSSRVNPLTPNRSNEAIDLMTPSRMMRTPRASGNAATAAPETPFTRQLNALLSEGMPSSPSQTIDFSLFPTFTTPGRNHSGAAFDFLGGEFSSDFPCPSSPPTALGFSVFEDHSASTGGLWSDGGIFDGSDTMVGPLDNGSEVDQQNDDADLNTLKIHGISTDFEVLIAQVAGNSAQSPTDEKLNVDNEADYADLSPSDTVENDQKEVEIATQAPQGGRSEDAEVLIKVDTA